MKSIGNLLGIIGLLWLAYFWAGVGLYPHVRFPMPLRVNTVIYFTMGAAVLCAFAGKAVSKRWWAGVALAIMTTLVIFARVRQ